MNDALPDALASPGLPKSVASPQAVPQPRPQPIDLDAEMAKKSDREEGIRSSYGEKRAAVEKAILQQEGEIDGLTSQPSKSVPLPENHAKHMSQSEMMDSAGIYMTLGALAGLLTKQPLSASLNNMTAAMQGIKDGDQTRYEQAFKEYEGNFKKAMDQNKAYLNEKEKILSDRHKSLAEKQRELKMLALKENDEVSASAKDWSQIVQLATAHRKASESAEKSGERVRRAKARSDDARGVASGGAGHGFNADDVADFQNERRKRGLPPINISGTKAVAEQKMREVSKLAKEWKETGVFPDLGVAEMEQKATAKAYSTIEQRAALMDQSAYKIEADIKTLQEFQKRGALNNGTLINRVGNSLRRAAGDPELAPYALAVKQVATEYKKTMVGLQSNANMPVTAMKDAEQILSADMPIKTANEVVGVMLKEMANAREAAKKEKEDLRKQSRAVGVPPQAHRSTDKPRPTDDDIRGFREYVKSHPGDAEKLKADFGAHFDTNGVNL